MNKLHGILLMGVVLLGGVLLLNMGVLLGKPAMSGVGGVVMVFALVQAVVLRRKLDREHDLLLYACQEVAQRKGHAAKPIAAAAATAAKNAPTNMIVPNRFTQITSFSPHGLPVWSNRIAVLKGRTECLAVKKFTSTFWNFLV